MISNEPQQETTEQLAIHCLLNSTGQASTMTPERLRAIGDRLMMLSSLPSNRRQGQVVDARDRFRREA